MCFLCFAQIIVFDIKAGNVLLDQDRVTAKITDVGLSKMLAGSNTATLLVGPKHASSMTSALVLADVHPWLSSVRKSLHDLHKLYAKRHRNGLIVCCSLRLIRELDSQKGLD